MVCHIICKDNVIPAHSTVAPFNASTATTSKVELKFPDAVVDNVTTKP